MLVRSSWLDLVCKSSDQLRKSKIRYLVTHYYFFKKITSCQGDTEKYYYFVLKFMSYICLLECLDLPEIVQIPDRKVGFMAFDGVA